MISLRPSGQGLLMEALALVAKWINSGKNILTTEGKTGSRLAHNGSCFSLVWISWAYRVVNIFKIRAYNLFIYKLSLILWVNENNFFLFFLHYNVNKRSAKYFTVSFNTVWILSWSFGCCYFNLLFYFHITDLIFFRITFELKSIFKLTY